MSLWRLEWLRLVRTRRWLSIAGIVVVFGFISPLTVRYAEELFEGLSPGGDVQIILPEATPLESMQQFVGNVQQLGTLVVVLVAAAAMAVDSHPEMAVFLRTRVRTVRKLIFPRFGANAALAAAAYTAGALAAWYETEVLIGSLPVGRTLAAIAGGALFQVLVVAVVVLAAGLSRSFIQTAVVAVGILLSLPLLGLIGGLDPWLPSRLATNLAHLDTPQSVADYVRPLVVTLGAILACLFIGIARLESREL